MKTIAIALGLALGCAMSAQAADQQMTNTSQQDTSSSHHATMDLQQAFHRAGLLTRHAWHRIDARLHRLGHHDQTTSS